VLPGHTATDTSLHVRRVGATLSRGATGPGVGSGGIEGSWSLASGRVSRGGEVGPERPVRPYHLRGAVR